MNGKPTPPRMSMDLIDSNKLIILLESVAEDSADKAIRKYLALQQQGEVKPAEQLLTLQEAASLLQVSKATLRALRQANHVRTTMVGPHPRIKREEITRYLTTNQD